MNNTKKITNVITRRITQIWEVDGRTFSYHGGHEYRIGCAGLETPFRFENKYYLYVWNMTTKKHEYYCFDDDIYISDFHMENMMERRFLKVEEILNCKN
jgi:hypothetical protein